MGQKCSEQTKTPRYESVKKAFRYLLNHVVSQSPINKAE